MSQKIQNLENFIIGSSNELVYMAVDDFLILWGKSTTEKVNYFFKETNK